MLNYQTFTGGVIVIAIGTVLGILKKKLI